MSDFEEALCWYRLFLAKGLGPKRLHQIHKLIAEAGTTAEQLCSMGFEGFQSLLPRLGRPVFDAIHDPETDIGQEFQTLLENEVQSIHLGHESYPKSLLENLGDAAPPVLFCRGSLNLLKTEGVAIVGSRRASEKALGLACALAQEFALSGKNVISGYAKGIDRQSHLGALRRGGTTTIVLSAGILSFSKKKEFEGLRWEGNVLALSQFHPSDRWRARNAMIRNRLVCALSRALVVVESGPEIDEREKMSGTFNAGRAGIKMGIPVFAVDPAALEKQNTGNRELIRLGAIRLEVGNGPAEAVSHVLKTIEKQKHSPASPSGETEQMSLFS